MEARMDCLDDGNPEGVRYLLWGEPGRGLAPGGAQVKGGLLKSKGAAQVKRGLSGAACRKGRRDARKLTVASRRAGIAAKLSCRRLHDSHCWCRPGPTDPEPAPGKVHAKNGDRRINERCREDKERSDSYVSYSGRTRNDRSLAGQPQAAHREHVCKHREEHASVSHSGLRSQP